MYAFYRHCSAQCLNRVIADSVKDVAEAACFIHDMTVYIHVRLTSQ